MVLSLVLHTVNVQVPSIKHYQWPANQTLLADRVVVPIFPKRSTDILRVRGCGRFKLPGNVTVHSHAVELGFSETYEKVQGKTLDKIILDLNEPPTRPLQLPALYTGITRVRKGSDLKILPVSPGHTLQHLIKLKLDQKLTCWLHGFDPLTARWSRDKAKLYSGTQSAKKTKKNNCLITPAAKFTRRTSTTPAYHFLENNPFERRLVFLRTSSVLIEKSSENGPLTNQRNTC